MQTVISLLTFMGLQKIGTSRSQPLRNSYPFVAPTLDRSLILSALRERIDPVFLPRPLHLVDALPRNATGKLPRESLAELARTLAPRRRGRPA